MTYDHMRVVHQPVIGDVVYVSYTPAKVGRIVAVIQKEDTTATPPRYFPVVSIKWLRDGEVTEEKTSGLSSFVALVEEHERKAKKHRETLNKVMKQIPV